MFWVNNGLKIKKLHCFGHDGVMTLRFRDDRNQDWNWSWHSEKIETLDIKEFLNMLPPLKVSGPHAVMKQLVAIIWDFSRKTNNCRTGRKMKECYIAGGQEKSN